MLEVNYKGSIIRIEKELLDAIHYAETTEIGRQIAYNNIQILPIAYENIREEDFFKIGEAAKYSKEICVELIAILTPNSNEAQFH